MFSQNSLKHTIVSIALVSSMHLSASEYKSKVPNIPSFLKTMVSALTPSSLASDKIESTISAINKGSESDQSAEAHTEAYENDLKYQLMASNSFEEFSNAFGESNKQKINKAYNLMKSEIQQIKGKAYVNNIIAQDRNNKQLRKEAGEKITEDESFLLRCEAFFESYIKLCQTSDFHELKEKTELTRANLLNSDQPYLPSLDLARLSAAVYKSDDTTATPDGYEKDDESFERFGMKASLYYLKGQDIAVLVFRGSSNLPDWTARDVGIVLSDDSHDKYSSSTDLAATTIVRLLKRKYKNISNEYFSEIISDLITFDTEAYEWAKSKSKKIFVTGHSLGGLHAQITAHMFGISGASFNAPGPKKGITKNKLFKRTDHNNYKFINHMTDSDIVSNIGCHNVLNETYEYKLGIKKGFNIPKYYLDSHSMSPIIDHLQTLLLKENT